MMVRIGSEHTGVRIEFNEERRMQVRAAKARKPAYKLARLVLVVVVYII